MADKMSISDLRRAVMVRTGATEQEISTFHNALKEQIVEALRKDKQVKINGLGTFRLQAIAPRKSVNIATGETITIEGYNKLTFVPEVSIKELVGNNPLPEEKPSPKTQTANKQADSAFDPIKKLGEQADEIVDILATLGQGPKAEQPIATPQPAEEVEQPASMLEEEILPTEGAEQPIEERQPAEEEQQEEPIQPTETPLPVSTSAIEETSEQSAESFSSVSIPTAEEKPTPTPETTEPQESEQTIEATEKETPIEVEVIAPKQPQQAEEKKEPEKTIEIVSPETHQPTAKTQTTAKAKKNEKPKKKYHFLRDTLICVCCLLLLLVGGFIFLREALSQWVDSLNNGSSANTEVAIIPADTVATAIADTVDSIAVQATPAELIYSEFITTEQVRDGSRLAQIARRHYGEDKIDLWVYIYDANKDRLSNPNDIKVGTELRIPKLSDRQMDLTDPTTQEEIKQLKAQIQSRTE
ncbi:MAG: HU family DNA-binding protein [Paludibacteraceae bacterium]|nr:HU family DNA-binding protein [Bacteroidales bacterium]MDY4149555.1 HU family DNA-binding protein [Paludibacteraceae bacterium]